MNMNFKETRMSTPDDTDKTSDEQPVTIEDALDLTDEEQTPDAPSGPSDQPSLPDFNS